MRTRSIRVSWLWNIRSWLVHLCSTLRLHDLLIRQVREHRLSWLEYLMRALSQFMLITSTWSKLSSKKDGGFRNALPFTHYDFHCWWYYFLALEERDKGRYGGVASISIARYGNVNDKIFGSSHIISESYLSAWAALKSSRQALVDDRTCCLKCIGFWARTMV